MTSLPVQRPGPGTPVTVVGLARSGVAAAQWLLQLGCLVRVSEASDSPAVRTAAEELTTAGALVEVGRHSRDFVEGSHLVVTSPGVPWTAQPLAWARTRGIPVVSELELGSWYCGGRLAAITGSNGKSTVVTLTGEILREAGFEVMVAGNIGRPLCGVLDQARPATRVVVEVSSFQLESCLSFHPEVACVLNLTNNHLDRHKTFEAYRAAKARLLAFQRRRSWALLNADDKGSTSFAQEVQGRLVWFSRRRRVQGAYLEGDWLTLNLPNGLGPICRLNELARRGPHHEENALAACAIAGLLGASPAACASVLRRFEGLQHRQQEVAVIRGVTFVNDSKSTTVGSGLRALEAAPGAVILIAGGRDKGSDFSSLARFRRKIKALVAIGEDGHKIAQAVNGLVPCRRAASLKEAVGTAFEMAAQGEWVLLSPMCTSFDMFRDFEERGCHFVEAVQEIGAACVP